MIYSVHLYIQYFVLSCTKKKFHLVTFIFNLFICFVLFDCVCMHMQHCVCVSVSDLAFRTDKAAHVLHHSDNRELDLLTKSDLLSHILQWHLLQRERGKKMTKKCIKKEKSGGEMLWRKTGRKQRQWRKRLLSVFPWQQLLTLINWAPNNIFICSYKYMCCNSFISMGKTLSTVFLFDSKNSPNCLLI